MSGFVVGAQENFVHSVREGVIVLVSSVPRHCQAVVAIIVQNTTLVSARGRLCSAPTRSYRVYPLGGVSAGVDFTLNSIQVRFVEDNFEESLTTVLVGFENVIGEICLD